MTTYSSYSNIVSASSAMGLDKFRLAKKNLDEGLVHAYDINILGDSISEGYESEYPDDGVPLWNNSFVGLLRSHFNTKYQDVGLGVIPIFTFYDYPLWVLAGTWLDIDNGFLKSGKYTATNGDTATLIFNGIGLVIITQLNQNFTVTIDGGASTTFVIPGVGLIKILVALGLSDTSHTAIFTHNGTLAWDLYGGYIIKTGTGFRFNNISHAGESSWGHQMAESLYAAKFLNPILTILVTGANECIGGYNIANYKAYLQTIINDALLTGDVILVSDLVLKTKTKIEIEPYVTAMNDIAVVNSITHIDLYTRWNYQGDTLGFLSPDNVHPNKAGHIDIADAILEILD